MTWPCVPSLGSGWRGWVCKSTRVRNAQATADQVMSIHTPGSAVEVWVVPTDEGVVAAREAARLLRT